MTVLLCDEQTWFGLVDPPCRDKTTDKDDETVDERSTFMAKGYSIIDLRRSVHIYIYIDTSIVPILRHKETFSNKVLANSVTNYIDI